MSEYDIPDDANPFEVDPGEAERRAGLDSEVALLGAAMSGTGSNNDLDDMLAKVEPADFWLPFHQAVWEAIGRNHLAGQIPSPQTVRLALDNSQERYDPLRLIEMTSTAPLLIACGLHAEKVLLDAGKRRLASASARLGQLASSANDDLEILREEARAAVDEATAGKVRTEAVTLAQVMPTVLDVAEHGRAKMLNTGWADVDRLIGGLAPGRLVVVGARPGVGKSLMGTNLALHFAGTHEHGVLIASMEMDREEVTQRMLANHARASLTGLMNGQTDEQEWLRISRCHTELEAMPIRVLDAPSQTVTSIRREARNFRRERPDLALIVVDYLQLLTTRERQGGSRAGELGEVSRGLKTLARETGACVVAMAQVNREAAKSTDGRPRVHDLRESGSIEADADVVLLLHQSEELMNKGEIEVLVGKNRHGPKGMAHLRVRGHWAQLSGVERASTAAWTPTSAIGGGR